MGKLINDGGTCTLRVRVDLNLLRSHLINEDGRGVDTTAVRRWLIEAGFLPHPDGDGWWVVREDDLGHLDPSEVLDVIEMLKNG